MIFRVINFDLKYTSSSLERLTSESRERAERVSMDFAASRADCRGS